ncbi:MAG: acyl-CoA synthetase [Arenicellales bacterium]|nr:acyl-CoA synthetase [Arenicellales bacterium]
MQIVNPDYTDFDKIHQDFRWTVPERYNMAWEICDKHKDLSQSTALYFESRSGETITTTFGELKKWSNKLANALAELGIAKGDRVGIVLPQRVETGIAHIAIHKLGAVSLPLSVLFGPEAIEYRLADSGAKAVITMGRHVEMIQDLKSRLPALEVVISCEERGGDHTFWPLLEKGSEHCDIEDTLADDPALLIYTSGTTGPPKGALVAHRSLLGNLPGFELSQNFYPEPNDIFWTPADWAWTGGLLDGLMPTWYYGKPIVAYESGKFDAEKACYMLGKYKVTNAFIPPTALKMMRQVPNIDRYGIRMRGIMSAGESLGAELFEWGHTALTLKINEMWGQTEFNYLVGNCAVIMDVKPGAMGKPYPGHQVEVIDDAGHPLPPGENGELAAQIGDPVMFLTYWNNEQAKEEKLSNKWFRTGDVGYKDADGYFWFVGRKDDVISSAGHRIGPGEIEDSLLKHPAVAQAAVIGSPDELRGNIVKAFIVLAEGQQPSDELKKEIQVSVKNRLAAHEYPRAVEFIDEMPMTTTGKIRRLELRKMDEESR